MWGWGRRELSLIHIKIQGIIVLFIRIKCRAYRESLETSDNNAFLNERLLCIISAKAGSVALADVQAEGGGECKAQAMHGQGEDDCITHGRACLGIA